MLDMDDTNDSNGTTEIVDGTGETEAPIIEEGSAPPIHSRFLFVDVAALRAKQLRRGARPRLRTDPGTPLPHKAERVAMAEVSRGLVYYDMSAPPKDAGAEGA